LLVCWAIRSYKGVRIAGEVASWLATVISIEWFSA
jgi:hypothetical protein